ncbi:MAG TPA: HAD-IIIA family hydrolase [Candidatus Elarobacter sp.]
MTDIVIPTIGRPSLTRLLDSLARSRGPLPEHVILVDDRVERVSPLALDAVGGALGERIVVLLGSARGPAAARNVGWRASRADWIAFLDDDVVVDDDWLAALDDDLRALAPDVAASTGVVRVPLPHDRRPTDWERNVAGLAEARWITADCAYRRSALLAAGGFDERFPRAYREDADLALRVVARGKRVIAGSRTVSHPVRPAPWWISVALQAGNADDTLMAALHGRRWREAAGAPPAAFRSHAATVATALVGAVAVSAWALQTARFAWRRIAPGPRTPREIAAMTATSVAIPFAAVYHRLRGLARLRATLADRERAPRPVAAAVLFDRDGTLIEDVPGNRDPDAVLPVEAARDALARLREAGVATAVVSNQAAVGEGRLAAADLAAIHAQTEALLGPLGPILVCTHAADAGCRCRKPAPGLIEAAARALGVCVEDCVVIGDIGADVEAARAAGARAILVPTPATRAEEIAAAPLVAADLRAAVGAVLGGAA